MTSNANTLRRAKKYLQGSTIGLFSVTMLGLWLFTIYILALYCVAAIQGNFEGWNVKLPHGYVPGETFANVSLGFHLIFAGVISFIAPLQLIPKLRNRMPVLHRWAGRIYIFAAFTLALSGLYLEMSGRKTVGDWSMQAAIAVNAFIILVSAWLALYHAIKRKFAIHKRWALRLFWAVNGVFMFRLLVMFWMLVNQGPRWVDVESFTGIPLTIIAICVYILPLAIVEAYLRALESRTSKAKAWVALSFNVITLIFLIGTFGATMGLWLPHVTALL
jgi:hypothetical protein